jgi:hypothetical protein
MNPTPSRNDERDPPAPISAAPGERELLGAVPPLARVGWFALGALVASTVALLLVTRPWARAAGSESAPPYEIFPFADNAGVCQEYVALATLRTSHEDARATVQRLLPALPTGVRPDNLRIVRAFAPGDFWTIAVDTQPGAGELAQAAAVAEELNALAGTGLRFEATFYSSRRLYDTARVLCMPRQAPATP